MKSKVLFGLSILAGLIAVGLVQFHIRSEKGAAVVVFRATADVRAGSAIGGNLEPVTLPGDKLFPNILKEAPTGEMADFVANTPTKVPIRAGEMILYRHLENTVDPGVTHLIPLGMKAISIPVNEASAVSYMVQPGDYVDVLAVVPDIQQAANLEGVSLNSAGLPVSKTLLQAARVLAVGGRYRRSDVGPRDSYSSVALLVTLEEAQKLSFAIDVLGAEMTLVLRSPDDNEINAEVRSVGMESPDFDRIGNRRTQVDTGSARR